MKVRRLLFGCLIVALAVLALMLVFSLDEGDANLPSSGGIRLNEIMSSNKGAVPDGNGNFPDWIELRNTSSNDINISGYGLSDDKLVVAKWVFPTGTTVPADSYILVFCSGSSEDGVLHANFKISATDEIVLTNATGQAIDSIALRAAGSNYTLARDENGNWVEMASPSPGYPNTEEGAVAYRESMQQYVMDNGIRINEFMASNKTTLPGSKGDYPDWIELYNTTGADVDITGCGLSDTIAQPMKWVFPAGSVVPAGGVLLIHCSGMDGLAEGELHAPFGLRAYQEDVVFAGRNGAIIDSYSFTNQQPDISMARVPDGTGGFEPTARPAPGYLNNEEGFALHTAAYPFPRDSVMISETMINNVAALTADNATPDWIELYNASAAPISLFGYALSDNPNNPAKWVFPDVTLDAGAYMVTLATGNNVKDTQKKNLETNFGLSDSGEVILLYSPTGELLDKLQLKNAGADISYGRTTAGELRYYDTPTPGEANMGGYLGFAAQPVFALTPGVYDGPVTLQITAESGSTIYYTTDSQNPGVSSSVYGGPLTLNENTVVRAIAVRDGYLSAAPLTGTYLFKSDGADHALPIATLVFHPDDLWDGKTGIYAFGEKYDPDLPIDEMLLLSNFYQGRGFEGEEAQSAWERDASFALFGGDGLQIFSQDVAGRLAGAYGRSRAQKAFTVIARAKYGSNRLEYPFFDNRPFTQYKSLTLRAGAQDQNYSKIRDELATGMLEGTDVNVLYQAYKPYVLYLNGEYWGVYFLKEKRSRFFVAQHEGTEDTDNMDLLKAAGVKTWAISHGSNVEWLELMNYIRNNDLSNQAHFDHVASLMDTGSFMDYMILEIYTGNTDNYNIQYYKLPDGKFKWIYYDFCWGFRNTNHETLSYRREAAPAGSDMFNALLKNSAWREAFIRRFGVLMDTVFAPERLQPLIDALYAAVEPEIAREREKFNQSTFMGQRQIKEVLGTYEGFIKEVQRVRDFVDARPAALKKQIQKEFSLTDSYMQEVFG
ncbi:MAG: lamin tail domain-containing protein [Clostridiales bacterium]|nr:lamin tail domain-containing protein [Clostridiales bacterium]